MKIITHTFFCLKAYIEQYLIMQRNHFHIKDFSPETAKSDLGGGDPPKSAKFDQKFMKREKNILRRPMAV